MMVIKPLVLIGSFLSFFKSQWKIVKDEVMSFVNSFYHMGKLGHGIDESFITVIPKVKNPCCVGEYRLISLVGSAYKIISKILVNRLKKVFGVLIGEHQFVFIESKQILDCDLIVNEMVDLLHKITWEGLCLRWILRRHAIV